MIRANHITQFAGIRDRKRTILDDISFTLRPGTLTVMLGPNGAGKSTLLRILSGEHKPDEGIVLWNGRSIHAIPPAKLALERGVLSQQYAMGLPFTVDEVVSMGRYPHQHYSDETTDRRIVRQCLQEMQVEHLSDRPFQTLSGGEQQRVQLARVLAQLRDDRPEEGRPKFLLLDEPTASMDWLQQQLCLEKARELARNGFTVVVVLHDLNLAAQFGDQLILLKQGRLLAIGDPAELLEPAIIAETYGIQASVLYPEGCSFPVIVPVAGATSLKEENYANE